MAAIYLNASKQQLTERVKLMTTTTLSKTAQKKLNREHAKERLLSYYLEPGDKVYTMVRSVSSSGMSRTMSVYVVKDKQLS